MTGRLIVMILRTMGSCRSDVKGEAVLSVFGVDAGEVLAAVLGHQSEDEGTWAVMPLLYRRD